MAESKEKNIELRVAENTAKRRRLIAKSDPV